MSAVATRAGASRTRPVRRGRSGPFGSHEDGRLFQPAREDGGPSLEELVVETWEDLVAQGSATCPVCGGRMRVVSSCEDCGSALS